MSQTSTWKLVTICILSGSVLGYNSGIIAAVTDYWTKHPYGKFVINDQSGSAPIPNQLSGFLQGIMVGAILAGGAIGSICGGAMADLLGRRTSLFILGMICSLGAAATAASTEVWMFIIARLFIGLSVGLATAVGPMYIGEMCAANIRGRFVTGFQMAICVSIMIAYAVGIAFENFPNGYGWRYMVACGALPGILLSMIATFSAESPLWLSSRSERMSLVKGSVNDLELGSASASSWSALFARRNWSLVLMAVLLGLAQQWTGINAIMFYAPKIFKTAGISSPLVPTLGVGAWNSATTLIAAFFVDRLGRRPLMLFGLTLNVAGLAMVAVGYFFFEHMQHVLVALVITGILIFIAGFEAGIGPLFFVILSEMFPQDIRSKGIGFANLMCWLFNLSLSIAFPLVLPVIHAGPTFTIFAGIAIGCLIYSLIALPETKGVSV